MRFAHWLLAEHDETLRRLHEQIQAVVPEEARVARLPGGNAIRWATYHVARHAALALIVVGAREPGQDARLAGFDAAATAGGAGLQEVEQDWTASLDLRGVERYSDAVFEEVRAYLAGRELDDLDERVDVAGRLRAAEVDPAEFGWLYRLWDAPVGFLVRWPMLGHVTNHVGEMIATRNQMGFSPFR
ncbi:MAG: hypothetical protein QOE37_1294 [Microbacteriaceae bacterium]|jgi:hypothetical protein|nr:hypothetical protein [Microbacteriaceae bacterium]